jgi:hypothetical protein
MKAAPLLVLLLAAAAFAQPRPQLISPTSPPEHGHGLSAADARAGWISLFDGKNSFGWIDGSVRDGVLVAGTTTSSFFDYELRADVAAGGDLLLTGEPVRVSAGQWSHRVEGRPPGAIRLGPDIALRSIVVRPLKLAPLLKDANDPGWKVIPHPTLPQDRQTKWQPSGVAALRATGGPGAVELAGTYADFVLQLDVTCHRPLSNAGVFFRSRPGDFLNGYEAQIFNACRDGDAGRPARYSTGAIDDRQSARRLVSRDDAPFTMTIIANGAHVATWVNGHHVTDWTDQRPKHDNPRQGLRLEPGTIQLQAHDRGTDVEFANIRVGAR